MSAGDGVHRLQELALVLGDAGVLEATHLRVLCEAPRHQRGTATVQSRHEHVAVRARAVGAVGHAWGHYRTPVRSAPATIGLDVRD